MTKLLISMTGILLILGATTSRGQSNILPPHSLTVTNFRAKADADFPSLAWMWIAGGGTPDNFQLSERVWSDSGTENFSILLTDDSGTRWLKLYSDTLKYSIVKLPAETEKILKPDGVMFIKALRKIFSDIGQYNFTEHEITGQVTLDDVSLSASAKELQSLTPGTRRFMVHTFDGSRTYIDAEVIIDYKGLIPSYRQVEVFVHKSSVGLKLSRLNTTK